MSVELETRVRELESLVVRLADDLEAEIKDRYAGKLDFSFVRRRFDRDMDIVKEARAALTSLPNTSLSEEEK